MVEGALRPQTWIESTSISARSQKELLRINGITAGEKNFRASVCPHPPLLAHNLLTVLAGPGAHRVSGRMAVTSRRGFGIHVSEGVRRAGMLWVRHQCVIAQEADHPRVIVHGKNMERGA